jgi:hypothetical protein
MNEPNFIVVSNEYSAEQQEALILMQIHDVMKVTMPFDEELIIVRVFGGYLYRKANQIPVFVSEPKDLKTQIKEYSMK